MTRLPPDLMKELNKLGKFSGGFVTRTKCPACGKDHRGKASPKCSRIKQEMFRKGEL